MSSKWCVTIWDRRAGGRGEQDLTLRFDAEASHLVGTAGDRVTTSDYVFTLAADDDYIIDSFCEVHAGYRDPDTGEWDGTRPLYGGFITEHTGHFEAARHLFDCTVSSHNILFDRTEILTWPTVVDTTPAGYGAGSVRDWLIGTVAESAPYDGIIPFHYQHFSNGGVDPVFDSILLGVDGDYIPAQGDSELFGHFGFMTVRALLDEIVKVAREAALAQTPALDVRPIYFWRLIPTGTTLIPQFCFMDLNAQSITPDAIYSSTPGTPTGSLPIEYPYRHTRNAQPARTRVTVKGEGTDPLTGNLNYFSYLKSAGDALYPTYYQIRAGWAGAPINESTINTIAAATRYSTTIGDQIWGPEGQITFNTRVLQGFGRRIALYFPADGQTGQIYPVIDHSLNLNPGSPIDSLVVGNRTRDLSDFIVPRPDSPMPTTDAGSGGGATGNASAAGLGRSGAQVAGGVKTRPVVGMPVQSDQNVVQPRAIGVVGQTWQATANIAPTPMAVAALPVPLTQHKDPAGVLRDWTDGTSATGHPQHYVAHITAAQTVLLLMPDPAVLRDYLQLNSDATVNTGVTVAFALNGTTVSPPSVGSPLAVARDDVLTVLWGGTFPAAGVAVLISERYPV